MPVEEHPTRTRLVQVLRRGGRTLADLQRETGLSRAAVRHHLLLLERDGLVVEAPARALRGRPPLIYQYRPSAPNEGRSPSLGLSVLAAMLAAARRHFPRRVGALLTAAAGYVAGGRREIGEIPDLEARLRASLAVLFDPATTEVRRAGDGFVIAVHRCPLLPAALQSPELCHLCPTVLRRLAGVRLDRQECIARGDSRCTYLATALRPLAAARGGRGGTQTAGEKEA
mgnify:CR=1 FL=1